MAQTTQSPPREPLDSPLDSDLHEAMLYERLELPASAEPGTAPDVHCFLCAQHCRIAPGKRGKCMVRENRAGTLRTLVWGRVIAEHVDPIEKKPLYHFHPGSLIYSIGTPGCNFACSFCQNADIAQAPRDQGVIFGSLTQPATIVQRAMARRCSALAYTYTEPTIFMEYALDVAKLGREAGLTNVFVSNGFMTAEALDAAAPLLDAANVDLKAFREETYRTVCGARLAPVLKTLEGMKARGIWLEVTTLVIPGLNDSDAELADIAGFLAGLDPDIPWHVSGFHPAYRMRDRPPTSPATLERAYRIGREAGLNYVYIGNVPTVEGRSTLCRACDAVLIQRDGYATDRRGLKAGVCAACGHPVPGRGLA